MADEFYYITAMNESYDQPSIPVSAEAGIIKGLYLFTSHVSKQGNPLVRLLGSGAIFPEVAEAAKMLEAEWDVSSEVWPCRRRWAAPLRPGRADPSSRRRPWPTPP